MGKRSKKASSQKEHFKKRMALRFGEDVTEKDINDIVTKIQSGETETVERQSRRVVIHKIIFRGQEINIPYDKQRKVPITALFDDETYDSMMYSLN